jgi:hypothetical protein
MVVNQGANMVTTSKNKPAAKAKSLADIKTPKKKTTVRRVHLADEKYTGSEPQWDTEHALSMTDEEFDHHLRQSFYYYNYHYTAKELKPDFVKWLQTQEYFVVSREDLARVIKSRWCPMTACSLITAHNLGMPLKPRAIQYLQQAVTIIVEKYNQYNEDVEQPAVAQPRVLVAKPTIQDRLSEKTNEIIGLLEGHFDEVCSSSLAFKHYDFLVENNVIQSQLNKYEEVYGQRQTELAAAQAGEDEQLTEGYANFKAADFKRIQNWIQQLLQAIEQYRGVKKATKKARIKRAPNKEKLVARLKYLKEEKTLKLVSINPVDVIGSQELWVYNAKTRKLGRYIAASHTELAVKGTTIINYDEQKSVSKTLRKPEIQLAEFMKSTKVQLRKYLDGVKATETLLNGRINAEVMLLRVV